MKISILKESLWLHESKRPKVQAPVELRVQWDTFLPIEVVVCCFHEGDDYIIDLFFVVLSLIPSVPGRVLTKHLANVCDY